MTDTNRTIWMPAPGRVEIRDSVVPCPGESEVLIRSHRTLISTGTELAIFQDDAAATTAWSEFARFPRRMGYSNAGEVVEAGDGVPRDWVGKRVASRGCHAAWVVRPVHDLRLIPAGVSYEEAVFATLASVVMHGMRRSAFTWGEAVAVFGLGIMGHLCARLCDAAGASRIFGIECVDMRLSKLPSKPFIHPLKADPSTLIELIRELNYDRAVDIVVEATGCADLIPREVEVLRDQGRLLLLSSPRGATLFHFHEMCNRRSITIVGAHGFSQPRMPTPDNPWTSQRHGEVFLEWVAAGRITVRELITHQIYFDQAADAYPFLMEHRDAALAVIFNWD